MNSKELRGSGEWLDLHGFGFAIIENIKPELSIEARHEIWQLEDMTSFGVCRVIDPWSNLPIHLLPRHPEGTDREFRIETGIGCDRTIALQQTVLEEEGTGVYRDVDTKLAVKLETISRTSEAWSNLELAHCQLLSRIRGLPPSDRNKI